MKSPLDHHQVWLALVPLKAGGMEQLHPTHNPQSVVRIPEATLWRPGCEGFVDGPSLARFASLQWESHCTHYLLSGRRLVARSGPNRSSSTGKHSSLAQDTLKGRPGP